MLSYISHQYKTDDEVKKGIQIPFIDEHGNFSPFHPLLPIPVRVLRIRNGPVQGEFPRICCPLQS